MIKSYVINRGLKYYTDMSVILNPIKEYLREYNFLITDIECNYCPDKRIWNEKDYVLIPSNELLDIVNTHEIQFIWGVFSAIPQHFSLDDILKYELPFSEAVSNYDKNISLQHPLADIEIVSFDSSYLEIICKNEEVMECIKSEFPKEKFYKKWN